jgi:hypothetical protein
VQAAVEAGQFGGEEFVVGDRGARSDGLLAGGIAVTGPYWRCMTVPGRCGGLAG